MNSILLFWLIGLVLSALIAWFAFVLIGAGKQDFAVVVGIGSLIPARIVPNLAGVDPIIYIPSVVLNTVTVGGLAALLLYIAYCSFRSTKPTDALQVELLSNPKKWPTALKAVGVLCVVAFWVGVRYAFSLLLNPSFVWYDIYASMAWALICISSLVIFMYVPTEVWLANAFAVLIFVPTFLPVPFAPGIWVRQMLLFPLLVFTMMMLFSAVEVFLKNRIPWLKGKRFPFVPAILVGLLLTTLWGDLVFGWLYPILLPLWQTV